MELNFGKYRGHSLTEVPTEYLEWLSARGRLYFWALQLEGSTAIRTELTRRGRRTRQQYAPPARSQAA